MKLNHINLTVTSVPDAAAFLETWFGFNSLGGNAGMSVLLDDDGFVLTLMKAGRTMTAGYPNTFHIGFFVADEAQVDDLNQRMRAAGIDVAPPERHHAYGFYVQAPGGFTIEIGA